MPLPQDLCSACNIPGKPNKKLHHCHYCAKLFHTSCGLRTIRLDNGASAKACPCHPTTAKTSDQSTAQLLQFSPISSHAPTPMGSESANGNASANHSANTETSDADSKLASAIMARLDSFDSKLNVISTNVNTKLSEMAIDFNTKLMATQLAQENMNERMKEWPTLIRTVEEHSSAIESLRRDNQQLRQLIESSPAGSVGTNPENDDRFSSLEEATATMQTEISALKSAPHHSHRFTQVPTMKKAAPSPQLVISGVNIPTISANTINLRKLGYAILKPLYSELELVDVSSARIMAPKGSINPKRGSSATINGVEINNSALGTPATVIPASSTASTSSTGSTASTSSAQPSSDDNSTKDRSSKTPRPPSIIVTLASASLVPTIIRGKIQLKKLHTHQLDADLISDSGLHAPLPASLIDVNEFLPGDIFKLLRWVRSKKKERGYACFTRDGCIYVRWTKTSSPVPINRPEDLEDFLMDSTRQESQDP